MIVVCITGNLGRDCEVKQLGGSTVCNFSVAVKSGFGDREQTVWFDCAIWGKQAESKLPDYLKKGQQVAVSGELSTYEADSGKMYLKVRCNSVDLVGGRADSAAVPSPAASPQQSPASNHVSGGDYDFEDDMPF